MMKRPDKWRGRFSHTGGKVVAEGFGLFPKHGSSEGGTSGLSLERALYRLIECINCGSTSHPCL